MSRSFHLNPLTPAEPDGQRTVAVTGAAGRIGRSFAEYAHSRYALTLLVHSEKKAEDLRPFGRVCAADLSETDRMKELFEGIDTVVHLAADPSADAEWDSLLKNNIEGTFNVFSAAVTAGCRRVVAASSIHAVSGYPPGVQVHPDDPVNPGDLYGVSKCFTEALGRMMAEQRGLSCIALRIGAFQPREKMKKAGALPMMNSFLSHRDLNQLFCRCIDDEKLKFAIFHALSDNRFNRMDISTAKELLGYDPLDDFTELNRELADLHLRRNVRPHNLRER